MNSNVVHPGVKECREAPKSINFNDEYHRALRTKPYVEYFYNKVQLLANQPSINYNHINFSDVLLEPCQETISSLVDSVSLSKTPKLKNLMLSYFEISAEASHICSQLLKTINQVHSDYQFIQRVLDIKDDDSSENFEVVIFELNSFTYSKNPLSNLKNHDFKLINDKHSSVLCHLKSMRKRVGRKIKLIKYLMKTSWVCVTTACGLVAITAMVIATHTLTAVILGPAILSFPFKHLKKKLRAYKLSRKGSLSKVYDQLDIAAKGTYILNRDFDTMSRLVARLHDEIEYNRAMVQFCLDRKQDKVSLQVVKELNKSDVGFRKQVEELEEHVYLCLVKINQARALVIKEMKRSCLEVLEGSFDGRQKKDLKQMEITSQGENEKFSVTSSEDDELLQVSSSSRSGIGLGLLCGVNSEGVFSVLSLEHCVTAPVETERNPLIVDEGIMISRSMTEKRGFRKRDTILDRLSERAKQLITNLVKIQNDGTVEVDLEMSAFVAPELLELQSFEESTVSGGLGSESKKSVPRLQIVILVVGTRGDEYGHHVRLATHANFKTFVKSAGVDFYPLGGDPRVLAGYMARNKGLIPSGPAEISVQRKQLKAIIDSLPPACTAPDMESGVPFRAQAIIANPPAYGHVHVAEALGVPLHIFFTMPWTPTYEFPHPLVRVPQSAGYWLSYIIVDLLIWWGMRKIINNFRKTTLKLAPIAYFSMYRGSISHLPTSYMWSPHVVPKPSDWGPLVDVVGYCFLSLASKYQPQEDFVQWIQKGPPPLYFGFGSMPLEDPKGTTDVILEALKDTEQRGIIDRGWGNLGNLAVLSDDIFLLEECPHDWLFPQCSAVVHHGGAGTTATGLKAGCPTTIVPFFGDQFFWGDRIYQKELGPNPIPISQLNVQNLANAIRFMLQPEVKSRALEIAKLIENEDGVAAAVDAFHRHLPDELPLPIPPPMEEDHLNPFQWFFLQIGR
ncbi:unnamed protein product [Sphenostylis stenocarpa]|uniref:Glycosyltransferase family 28 N-terminal domain-containing protein n=1 Tax=Sphenostylis stenocarpa TaxID=92480 RepID=A0AA87B9C5_9FABA|nr:unnamed protein product [Sphenostylis stenocarpa]